MTATAPERLEAAYQTALAALLKERTPEGHWVGELSTSALSTATAVMALSLVERHGGVSHRDLVEREVAKMKGLRIGHAEATYLSWIEARGLNTDDPAALLNEAGVGLYDGALFGAPGFLRLNFACPRPLLEKALARMALATEQVYA